MAEAVLDVRGLPKDEAYRVLDQNARLILEGMRDPIAAMATISCLVYNGLDPLWAGFYRVVEPAALLRVGPYQGTLGCLEIRFGSGVCGTAAAERRPVVVPDVARFPGHIACDARARSEVVVPVVDSRGELIAVFDLDSERLGAFDDDDARGLERLVSWFAEGAQ